MRWLPLVCLLYFTSALCGQETIYLASTEYPPFYGKDLPQQGLITEIIHAAFAQTDYRVETTFYPFSRALMMQRQCKVDGLFTEWDSPERRQWGLFSDPIPPENEVGFYKRANDDLVFSGKPLRINVGIVRDYVNPKLLNAPPFIQVAVTDDLTNLKKLSRGRVDLVFIDRAVAQHLMKTHMSDWEGKPIVWVEPAIKRYTQHLVLCKEIPNAEQKMAAFNRGLQQLKDNGMIEQLLKKHQIRPNQKTSECAIEALPGTEQSDSVNPHWLWP